jgi:hypothetical protein
MLIEVPNEAGKEGLQLPQALLGDARSGRSQQLRNQGRRLAVRPQENVRLVEQQGASRHIRPVAVAQQYHYLNRDTG